LILQILRANLSLLGYGTHVLRVRPFNVVISDAVIVEDYLQIIFIDGSVLSVYNPCLFEGVTFSDLKGRTLKEIREDKSTHLISLVLDRGTLRVNVYPDVWTESEAMVLYGPGHSIVIWS